MLKLKLLLAFFLLSTFVNAQTLGLNQSKYWDYRAELKTHFVKIGEGKGKSIPAEYFNPKKGRLHWGDGTMALGWYIGVLATEYHLSSKKGYVETGEGKEIDPVQTLLELSNALLAVDRLDRKAEPFFDKNAAEDLNGFLIRDDVGTEHEKDFPKDIKYIDSDYLSENPYSNEMSHDQTYELMIGLSLVKNFIPENTQVGGLFLNQMAVDQATRILSKLSENNWRLRNPVVKDSRGKKGKKVLRGHQSYIYSRGIKKMLRFFSDKKMKSATIFDMYWYTLRSGLNPTFASNSNSSMALAVTAVGNGFNENSYRKLIKRSKRHDWFFYPLLNKALYPLNRDIDFPILEKSQALIDEAPSDGIKSNFNREVSHGWGVNNRFYKFKKSQYAGKPYQVDREYNGLDF
ncbi:MAG: hypothetical protein ACI9EV_000254, partial [Urechidicola sp.]